MRRTFAPGLVFLCVGAALLAGCGRKAQEKTVEKAVEHFMEATMKQDGAGGKVKVDLGEGSVRVTSDEGEVAAVQGSGAKLPDDFPKDVLVYPHAKVESTFRMGTMTTVNLACGDSLDDVAAAYRKGMVESGWKQEVIADSEDSRSMIYTKDTRRATIGISARDGRTQILLSIVPAEG
jgi:hypothetical protein